MNQPGAGVDISVVVPTWNRSSMLAATLRSLGEQTFPASRFEVVVVDDGSVDDTADVVSSFAAASGALRVVLEQQANGGVNRARNRGLAAASGQAIAFIDDDELAPPGYLETMWSELLRHPEAAGVGGPALEYESSTVRTCANCTIAAVSLETGADGRTKVLLGGNMLVRRATFDEVGPFDPELSGRGDETEWFRRADRDFFYDDQLFVWHRRDELTRAELVRTQLRQGRSIPLAHRKQGDAWRPNPQKIPRFVLHSLTKKCDKGYLLAARELGASLSWTRLTVAGKLTSRHRPEAPQRPRPS